MKATFFNQPWLERKYAPGHAADAAGQVPGPQPLPRAVPRADRRSRPARAARSPPTRPRRGSRRPRSPRSSASTATRSPTSSSRCRRGCGPPSALPDRAAALAAAHFGDQRGRPRGRLAFEELLLLQLALLRRRALRREAARAEALDAPGDAVGALAATSRSRSRRRTTSARRWPRSTRDLATGRPMQRLLMGEVGSGKTVVALYAMLRAVEHGAQAALMAPTETLAEQHFATLQKLMPGELAAGGAAHRLDARRAAQGPARQARQRRAAAARRHARADRVRPSTFDRLAVAVVDEQHRFGVNQRRALDRKAPDGLAPARAAHDRDADPAHARPDRLRRPRRHRPAPSAGGAAADRDARRLHGARARPRLRAHPRGAARRAARRSSSARWSRSPRRCRRAPPRPSTSGCARPSCATSASCSCTGR